MRDRRAVNATEGWPAKGRRRKMCSRGVSSATWLCHRDGVDETRSSGYGDYGGKRTWGEIDRPDRGWRAETVICREAGTATTTCTPTEVAWRAEPGGVANGENGKGRSRQRDRCGSRRRENIQFRVGETETGKVVSEARGRRRTRSVETGQRGQASFVRTARFSRGKRPDDVPPRRMR